jgi:hypothetical protein
LLKNRDQSVLGPADITSIMAFPSISSPTFDSRPGLNRLRSGVPLCF